MLTVEIIMSYRSTSVILCKTKPVTNLTWERLKWVGEQTPIINPMKPGYAACALGDFILTVVQPSIIN